MDDEVEAAAALYAAAQLEELGVLRVCDRLVELYLRGGLPVGGPGGAAALLDSYWLGRAERLGEDERRELFAHAVGPGFAHLLGRLAAAIAADDAGAVRDDDAVAWAAGELRSHIDRRVDERALAAISILRPQLGDALAILSDAELLNAYGARDAWQLTDQLARLELGDTRDVARHQTLAASGTVVIGWLTVDDGAVTEEAADAARSWLAAAAAEPSP
ncbi:MAG TPA: hypothetical protein VGO80_01280 [Solirubrobacteraceae bacterium]|nr:hypothetical protein [Solirubrobacteraceae bacterium]